MENPPQNVTVLDGKDATITCRAVGAPTPNVTWIYNGKKKTQKIFFEKFSLTFPKLICFDFSGFFFSFKKLTKNFPNKNF